jgi:hypothetical protein
MVPTGIYLPMVKNRPRLGLSICHIQLFPGFAQVELLAPDIEDSSFFSLKPFFFPPLSGKERDAAGEEVFQEGRLGRHPAAGVFAEVRQQGGGDRHREGENQGGKGRGEEER